MSPPKGMDRVLKLRTRISLLREDLKVVKSPNIRRQIENEILSMEGCLPRLIEKRSKGSKAQPPAPAPQPVTEWPRSKMVESEINFVRQARRH